MREWKTIEDDYKYRRRGLREKVLVPAIREMSSAAPSQVGQLLSMVGVEGWAKKIDGARHVARGTTEAELEELRKRRNRIAHEGDRVGYGRAHMTVDEAARYVDIVQSIVEAIEAVLPPLVKVTD